MRLLLDTHAALWWLAGDPRFGPEVASQLADDRNTIFLSAVVVWEIAIKRSLGKLDASPKAVPLLLEGGVQPLPVTTDHAAAVEHLDWHHRDPFDRLLVAQALTEGAVIVSADPVLANYGVPVVW